ncbi:hypothetical protein B0H13DRAFT_2327876 [Mycena leptocephala]|nr:hypothetical protein B0H13DRAFT_2327876 [Mycena leptocephala]
MASLKNPIHGRTKLQNVSQATWYSWSDSSLMYVLWSSQTPIDISRDSLRPLLKPVATMLQYRSTTESPCPRPSRFMKAGANIGSVTGSSSLDISQIPWAEKPSTERAMLVIFATIMCLTLPTGSLKPDSCLIYLSFFRIVLVLVWCVRASTLCQISSNTHIDYPMSASITSDRAVLRKRAQCWPTSSPTRFRTFHPSAASSPNPYPFFLSFRLGSLVGSLVTIVVLAAYENIMNHEGKTSKVDAMRIVVGVSLIPAFGTLYQRLTLPESDRFKEAQQQQAQCDGTPTLRMNADTTEVVVEKPAHFREFLAYFSEWRRGESSLDVCQIGFDGKTGTPWEKLFKVSTGNIIVTPSASSPGYYATILLIETLGRKWINPRVPPGCSVLCAISYNLLFQPPADRLATPRKYSPRSSARPPRNLCSCGKAGAIISALAFNSLSESIGTDKCSGSSSAAGIAGAAFTLLLPKSAGATPMRFGAGDGRVGELRCDSKLRSSASVGVYMLVHANAIPRGAIADEVTYMMAD